MPEHAQPLLPDNLLDGVLQVWGASQRRGWMQLTGQSMLPLLRAGDQMLVAHGCYDLRRGDLPVFRRAGRLVVHRLIRIEQHPGGRRLITRGDNRLQCDAPLQADELVGRVLCVRRGARVVALDHPVWRIGSRLIAGMSGDQFAGLRALLLRGLQFILWRVA
jgi:signal peptidase I